MESLRFDYGILFILGVGVFGGVVGAYVFQKLRIPQVVGYIVIGLLIGRTGLGLVGADAVHTFKPFNLFALGIIGFLVGGELKIETFRKYARQFIGILLGEGGGAFVVVGVLWTLIAWYFLGDFRHALAVGVVFGAIASATDPASTIDVLWEYRAAGILTTTIIAIVALDDALAMMLYGLGTSAAQLLTSGHASIGGQIVEVSVDILGSLLVGSVCALIMDYILRRIRSEEKELTFTIGLLLLLISVAIAFSMDVILASMAMGFVLVNVSGKYTEKLFEIVRHFSGPIYVMFFVLVGARIQVHNMPLWVWMGVGAYVVGRSLGKMVGAYLTAISTGAEAAVRRYLGLGLFAQGGVAIGLSIMATHYLGALRIAGGLPLDEVVITVVTTTTLVLQIIGPPAVKLAVSLAGETGKKVTREDIVGISSVGDVMRKDVVALKESDPLRKALQVFASEGGRVYPVVNSEGKIVGILSLDNLREVLTDPSSWEWLIVADAMSPVQVLLTPAQPLEEAIGVLRVHGLDHVPVEKEKDSHELAGVFSVSDVDDYISRKMIHVHG